MNNWKTSLTALVLGISTVLSQFGILITPEIQSAVVVLAIVAIGFFAKDAGNKNLTGEEK